MASLATCHLGLWLGWQILLNQREPHAAPELATIIREHRPAQMSKFNKHIMPNKVCIGWHFSSNRYIYGDAYLALRSKIFIDEHR